MMQHKTLLGQAGYSNLNPKIPDLGPDMMDIPKKCQAWESASRLACVNSYGAAGSNAAVAVREAARNSNIDKRPTISARQPFFLSAATAQSLIAYSKKLLAYVQNQRESPHNPRQLLSDVLFSLHDRGNHALAYSVTCTVTDLDDLERKLKDIITGSEVPQKDTNSSPRPIVMVFGGQESEFVGLSEEVVSNSKLLRSHLDECDHEMKAVGLGSLYTVLYERESIRSLPKLHAALFSVQYASARAWIDSGMRVISSIIGHSFGQLTALCVSGTLSLRDGMGLVVGRAQLIEKCWGEQRGCMMSVQADRSTVEQLVDLHNRQNPDDGLEIACYNHPTNHVLVGTTEAISTLDSHANALQQSVRTKRLSVTHGYHSKFTNPLLSDLKQLANGLQWNKPTIHVELTTEDQLDLGLGPWIIPEHTRKPVYFTSAIHRLAARYPSCIWVEAGQGSSAMSLVKACLNGHDNQLYCPSLLNTPNATSCVADTVVALWKAGVVVQFWPYHRSQRAEFEYKSLPPYQFEKTQHWLPFVEQVAPEPIQEPAPAPPAKLIHDFISFLQYTDASEKEAIFLVDPESERYMYLLNGHVTSGQALAPASIYLELLSRATMILTKDATYDTHVTNMDNMQVKGAPIGLNPNRNIYIKLTRITSGVNYWNFEFSSRLKEGDSKSQIHTLGRVELKKRDDPDVAEMIQRWSALIGYKRCLALLNSDEGDKMQGKHVYQALAGLAVFSEMYHGMKAISYQYPEAAGKVVATLDPKLSPSEALYDTPTIDGMMQVVGTLVNYFAYPPNGKEVLLNHGIKRIVTSGSFDITAGQWTVYALITEDAEERTAADVYVFDPRTKQVVIAFLGFSFTRTYVAVMQRSLQSSHTGSADANPTREPNGATASLPPPPPPPPTQSITPAPTRDSTALSSAPQAGKASQKTKTYEVLHKVTDVPLNEMTDDLTLEELGIDSLLVTEVLTEIHDAFGLDIDLNTFLFFPSLKAIWSYIDSALGVSADVATEESTTTLANGTASTSAATTTPAGDSRPSFNRAQKVFSECRDAYVRAAAETGAVGFWKDVYPHQAALVLAYVVEAFAKLGCDMSSLKVDDVAPMIPHLDRHRQLVRQLYRVLEDGGYITVDDRGQFLRTAKAVDPTPASEIYKDIIPRFPLHADVHKIVQVVGCELAPCLTGEKDGLQMVFGNKENKKTLDNLYEHWPLVRSGTLALGEYLERLTANPDRPGKFRILEVGAGTGGTTRYIVRHLQKLGVPFEYIFTDLSASLVAQAKRAFKDCPEMEFQTLDIEKEPQASWVNAFHAIISTNCIHATRNLTVSLTSLRKMLRDDGVLCLVEITQNMYWLDIGVGLFEGWWLFEDGREHAVTHQSLWKEHMSRAGFGATDWTDGDDPESRTIRLITGFPTDVSA